MAMATDYQQATPLASARDLVCRRGGRILFAPIGFVLRPGQALMLRGPNGAGKSSLLRMIAGLLPVGAGLLAVSAQVALSDEHLALDDRLSLTTALSFWSRIDGADADTLDAALAGFALTPLRDIPVRMLSTGQRKRAMLARVMASGARLWLLDEPANGLDTASLDLLGAAMAAHLARGGAIIAASHAPMPLHMDSIIDLSPVPGIEATG